MLDNIYILGIHNTNNVSKQKLVYNRPHSLLNGVFVFCAYLINIHNILGHKFKYQKRIVLQERGG